MGSRSAQWIRFLILAAAVSSETQTRAQDAEIPSEEDVAETSAAGDAADETAEDNTDDYYGSEPQGMIQSSCQGRRIGRVRVLGNRRVADEDVLASVRSRVGRVCTDATLTEDARALWELGFFDDIRIEGEADEEERGRIQLIYRLRERPAIAHIHFEGNDNISDSDVDERVETREGAILSVPNVRRQVTRIRDLYAEKGYYLARVTPRIVPVENNEVDVFFDVVEGQKVSVRSIRFLGNRSISSDELRGVMQTGETGFFSFLANNDNFRQERFSEDQDRLQAFYYERGYLQMRTGTARVELTADRRFIDITVPVIEGPRFRIGRLRVVETNPEGEEVDPLGGRARVRGLVDANPGDWFARSTLGLGLQAITRHYRDDGYAHVDVQPQFDLDTSRLTINLTISVQRGVQVTIERINIRGNTKTRDGVIRREIRIAEGELYSQSRLEESRAFVQSLGYFERVEMSESEGSAPDRIIVNFEVAERATGTFQVGAGFSSIESFIFTAQVQQQNLFGNGQSLSLQLQLSGLRQLIQLQLVEPYLFDTEWTAAFEVFKTVRQFAAFNRDSTGGSLSLGHWLLDRRLTLFANYRGDYVQIGPRTGGFFGQGSGQGLFQFQLLPIENLFRQGLTSSVRTTLTWDGRDDRSGQNTRNGFYMTASNEFADDAIGSAATFNRQTANVRGYYEPFSGAVLKAQGTWGLITSRYAPGPPVYERFYLGGIYSVRGFQLNGLGPRVGIPQSADPNGIVSDTGIPVGGNMQFMYNVEFEFPIIGSPLNLRGVIFTDGGNAWNTDRYICELPQAPVQDQSSNPCRMNFFDIRTSWGFGIRWISPLGPLRFEWGVPFQRRSWEPEVDFQFTIGNFF